jgi:hypothetical protein
VLVLAMTIALWKRGQSVSLNLRCSSLLVATVLVPPHVTVYDLVILAPAFLLAADWLLGPPAHPSVQKLGALLYLVYVLPLLSPTARWTHVQLSVIAMAAALFVIWRASLRGYAAEVNTGEVLANRVPPN